MNNKKATKRALLTSVMALVMCVVMLVGTTFAWFTDTASTGVNKITSGNLHVEIQNGADQKIEKLEWVKENGEVIANQEGILWEPGCTYLLTPFKIVNTGNLALKYKIAITGLDGDADLLKVIKFTYKTEDGNVFDMAAEGHLTAKGTDGAATKLITVTAEMDKLAGNEYMDKTLEGVKFTVYATQDTVENDSFGKTYDANATYYPVIDLAGLKDAVKNGGNVAVDADVQVSDEDTVAQRTTISKPTTLQLNKKITSPYAMGNNEVNFTALIVAADTTINAGENGGIDTKGGAYGINVISGANLVINGGTYYGGGTAVQAQKGTVTINGGHFAVEPFSDARYGYDFLLNCLDANYKNGSAKIIVKGGTFVNFNPADCKAEGEGTNFVAEGYGVVATPQANGDVWYTVVEKSTTGTTFGSGTHTLSTGITATSANAVAVSAESGADITITGGAYDGGKGGNNVCVWAKAGSNVTIKDGTFTVGGDANGNGNAVIYSTGGNITIEGGFFYTDCSYRGLYYVLNLQNGTSGTITVKGGTFVNYDPSTGDDNLGGNFVADGYKVVSEAHGTDTWYTVVAK